MHGLCRLYLGVHSLTDYHETFRAAMERYDVRLVDFATLPAKPFVTAHLDFYRALNDAGVIHIFQAPGGEWHTFAYLCELTLPKTGAGSLRASGASSRGGAP